jgi:hypothetical protein
MGFASTFAWLTSANEIAQPILVIAKSITLSVFRKGMACGGVHSAAGRWRSDRTHPELLLAAP